MNLYSVAISCQQIVTGLTAVGVVVTTNDSQESADEWAMEVFQQKFPVEHFQNYVMMSIEVSKVAIEEVYLDKNPPAPDESVWGEIVGLLGE